MKRVLCLIGIVVGLAACPAPAPTMSDNIDKAARNVAKGLPEQSRLLMCSVASPVQCHGMPGPSDRDVIRAGVRDNATLACEIVTHDDKTKATDAAECKCASARSNEDFEAACGAWAGVK